MNVVDAIDATTNTVTAMEPWYPDPSRDPNSTFATLGRQPPFSRKSDGAPFKFTGIHIERSGP